MSAILSAWTVVVFVIFIGVVIWVFSKNKDYFDDQANIPFDEDESPTAEIEKKEINNG